MTFEEAMARLSEISDKMDNPQLSLEDSLKLYSEATELTDFCKKQLDGAKLKLEKVSNDD